MSQLKCTTDKHFISTNSQQHLLPWLQNCNENKIFLCFYTTLSEQKQYKPCWTFLVYFYHLSRPVSPPVVLYKPFTLYILMLGWSQSILAGIDIVNNTLLNTAVTRIQYMEYIICLEEISAQKSWHYLLIPDFLLAFLMSFLHLKICPWQTYVHCFNSCCMT